MTLVLAGVGVLLVGVAFLSWSANRDESTTLADIVPSPTYSSTYWPTYSVSPSPSGSPSRSASPSASASASASPTPSPTSTQTEEPVDYEQVLKQNGLYSAGKHSSVSCNEYDGGLEDQAAVESYYATVYECLNQAWGPQLKQAGLEFRKPTVLTWSGSATSPCGEGPRAFYCGTNETIYMKWDDHADQYNKFSEHYQKVYARMLASQTSAHEYGHHIQQLVGVLPAAWDLRSQASRSASLELSRRTELQASCLAGVFWGANQPSYPIRGQSRKQYMFLIAHLGDEYNPTGIRDHGSRFNHKDWTYGGFTSENPSKCDTFSSSSESVS